MLSVISEIGRVNSQQFYGRVAAIQGLLVEVGGIQRHLSIGSRVDLLARGDRKVACEVVGFRNERALLMPFGSLEGVGMGCKALIAEPDPVVFPDKSWLGRVVNAMGEPIDGGPPLVTGNIAVPLKNMAPPAHSRQRVGGKIDLGFVHSILLQPVVVGSGWASSRVLALVNPCSSPCWLATQKLM
nr:hypothetical protein [Sneathiella glossodoripedis]